MNYVVDNAIVVEPGQPLPPKPEEGQEAAPHQGNGDGKDEERIMRMSCLKSATVIFAQMAGGGMEIDARAVIRMAHIFETEYVANGHADSKPAKPPKAQTAKADTPPAAPEQGGNGHGNMTTATEFWRWAQSEGWKPKEVPAELHVASMDEWIGSGKTYADAAGVLAAKKDVKASDIPF